MTCGKTVGTSLKLGGWGYGDRRLTDLSQTPMPLESEVMMDSGVSKYFFYCQKGVKPAEVLNWPPPLLGLGDYKQATVKPKIFYIFQPFDSVLCPERLDARAQS